MRRHSNTRLYVILIVLLGGVLASLWLVAEKVRGGEVLAFKTPDALLLLLGVVLVGLVGLYWQPSMRPSFWFSRGTELRETEAGWVSRVARLPTVFRMSALALMTLAIARPQTYSEEERTVEGIDIMFVLDVSKSMEEQDLPRNRLDAGQRTIRDFLHAREGRGDRIGLVVFAKEAMLQCPLTLDYLSLESIVAGLEIGEVPALGTAIGDALGLSLASLRRSSSASKVVILLSDGDWNKAHYMDPDEARDLAVQMGVRVFTVLLGQDDAGQASGVGFARSQYAVNPEVLKGIAKDTGGLYFNAASEDELSGSFEKIRKSLTKSENRLVGRAPHLELFDLLLWPAFALLLLELLLRMTRFRSFP